MSDTRERIREAALKLFIERGYEKTTIADIERAAGLAPRAGSFYRHYPGKVDLAVDIGQSSIIETREDLGLDLLPLGDTRAELVLIAKGYSRTGERQAALADLIFEVRHIEEIRELERRVSEELLSELTDWLGSKPYAADLPDTDLQALAFTIFGGLLFFLSKRGSGIAPDLTEERMVDSWADFWTGILDQSPGPENQDPGNASGPGDECDLKFVRREW